MDFVRLQDSFSVSFSVAFGGPIYFNRLYLVDLFRPQPIQALADHAAELSCRRSSLATRACHRPRLPVTSPSRHLIRKPPATALHRNRAAAAERHAVVAHVCDCWLPGSERHSRPLIQALTFASSFVGKARPLLLNLICL